MVLMKLPELTPVGPKGKRNAKPGRKRLLRGRGIREPLHDDISMIENFTEKKLKTAGILCLRPGRAACGRRQRWSKHYSGVLHEWHFFRSLQKPDRFPFAGFVFEPKRSSPP
jgi:hypothetical protein